MNDLVNLADILHDRETRRMLECENKGINIYLHTKWQDSYED